MLKERKKIIETIEKLKLFGSDNIETQIYPYKENCLLHKFSSPIIHSGEFTGSMAYDVTQKALELAILLEKESVYSFDLFPHNFTYYNGN